MSILDEIISKRKSDIAELGFSYGCDVPKNRGVPVRPFLQERGAILEIKRASPSKGDIAPNLDAVKTALAYAEAGARAVSVLTEKNYFKGSLRDLMAVRAAFDEYEKRTGKMPPAVLRKDFLTDIEDIEVAFRAGADAVLLIARVLTKNQICAMGQKVSELGMNALIEVREEGDIEKVSALFEKVGSSNFICGVNSRDLKDFSIDMLVPCAMQNSIKKIAPSSKIIFESGILSPECAAFVGSCGFDGFLMGEAAAKNPQSAKEFINAFENAPLSAQGKFWIDCAEKLSERNSASTPLVKICGITKMQDAILAAELGADFLGFIFCEKSRRNTNADFVKNVRLELQKKIGEKIPRLVAVVTELASPQCDAALRLVREKIIDAIQFHGFAPPSFCDKRFSDIPRFAAANVSTQDDVQKFSGLLKSGEPRVLIDSRSENAVGGTGVCVDKTLSAACKKEAKLWLAGGINAENVREIIAELSPELLDISSGVESEAGVKDEGKLRDFFNNLEKN